MLRDFYPTSFPLSSFLLKIALFVYQYSNSRKIEFSYCQIFYNFGSHTVRSSFDYFRFWKEVFT